MVGTKTHSQPPFPPQHGRDSGTGRVVAVLFAREGAGVAIVCLPEEESNTRTTGRTVENEGRTAPRRRKGRRNL